MGFDIPKVDDYKFFLDVAFKKARTLPKKKYRSTTDKHVKLRIHEIEKVKSINDSLNEKLKSIITSFPNFDNLNEFYQELVSTLIDFEQLKKSLGALNWAQKKIFEFSRIYQQKMRKESDPDNIKKLSTQYYGRISSVFKQIKSNLLFLEESRKIMRQFPSIRDGLFTVAIAGFPNIGKSTVLSKLTGSTPDIQPYAFTTKNLNVGYLDNGHKKIQFIDTPGTLNRLDKMNKIEQIAYLAVKYYANVIIYIYDLTEVYPLKDQKKLHKRYLDFDKKTIVYLSKTDIIDSDKVKSFKKKDMIVDLDILKEKIIEESSNYS